MKKILEQYSNEIYPFHMPGHKLGRLLPLGGVDLSRIDVTEVEGTDQLFEPSGIIYDTQKHASELYETIETFLLVNGSTSGILSAISSCCQPDGKILMSRNCHKSVYNGILINRLDPIYIYPDEIDGYHLSGGINPKELEKKIIEHPDISCVVITSPTYEGFTSDIIRIAQITKQYGLLLIVDEAHGAHFKFNDYFPKSALECGADIVIHSLHKTLPAFTQSALLHVNSTRVDIEKIKQYLSIYQTSSPSYILMAGMDSCLNLIASSGSKQFNDLIQVLKLFRNKAKGLSHFNIIGDELIGKYHIHNIDLSKLLFVGKKFEINGKLVDNILRKEFHIQVEMAMRSSFLALTSIADHEAAFTKFYSALQAIDIEPEKYPIFVNKPYPKWPEKANLIPTTKVYTPFETSLKQTEQIQVKDALDRICAQYIYIYPPGIPMLVPGEKITANELNLINDYLLRGFSLIGIDEMTIKVVK